MNRRSHLTALLAVAFAAAPRSARASDALSMATVPIDAGAEVYYALDEGFFREASIDANVQAISSGAAITAAVASGAIDIGFSNLISIAAAFKRGIPFTLLAPGSLYSASDPTSVLMVPKNSPAKTAKDLDGKIFGCNGLKTITQYAAQYWIDKNGGDSTTLKYVEMSFPDILQGLGAERIDAAIVAEPFITQAKSLNDARILANAYDAIGSVYIIGCWFTTQAWATAHAPLAARFADVMARTAAWANTHKPQSGVTLTKYGKLSPEVARTMLRVNYAPRFVIAEMQPVIEVAARYGGLPASFPSEQLIFKPTAG